ncbi:MAG: hypothetical protein R3C01_07370 [Planctomycetaceae bacterium]
MEFRTLTTTTNLVDSGYLDWPGGQRLIRFERHTTVAGKVRSSTTFAITDLSRAQAVAQQRLRLLRARWAIKNSSFLVADTTLRQDYRTRIGHAVYALANRDYFATNLARQPQRSHPNSALTCPQTQRTLPEARHHEIVTSLAVRHRFAAVGPTLRPSADERGPHVVKLGGRGANRWGLQDMCIR